MIRLPILPVVAVPLATSIALTIQPALGSMASTREPGSSTDTASRSIRLRQSGSCFCQSGVWTRQGGSGTYGGWKLKVTGHNDVFYGVGLYVNSTGRFSGSITCDFTVGGADGSCGQSGMRWDTTADSVWGDAKAGSGCGTGGNGCTVRTINLPVNTVTQQW